MKPDVLVMGAFPEWDLIPIEAAYTVHKVWLAQEREAFLPEVTPKVRAIATRGEIGASRALIERCPRLEIIACYEVGVDAIDLDAARARGVRVTNTPDLLTDDVADFALALILASLRKIVEGANHVRSGAWAHANLAFGTSLRDKTVGLLGFGRIGRAVARLLLGFGVEIAYRDIAAAAGVSRSYHQDVVSLAKASDILVLTVSGGDATRRIVNAQALDTLGPEGPLVNVARGSVIDEDALISALRGRRIRAAALDVFLNEPKIDARLLEFENVLLQPHQSSATVETRRAMGKLVRDNLAAHFAGGPLPTPVV